VTTLITTARGPCRFSAVIYNGYRSMPNRLPLQLDGHYVYFKALFTVVIFNMGLICVCVCVCVCVSENVSRAGREE
jgi:uncharacterized membrane protein